MPKALIDFLGYAISFWLNENEPLEPVHVHVAKGKPTPNATKVWITRNGVRLEHNNSKIPRNELKEILNFINENNFTIGSTDAEALTFGDSNTDGVVNAQDALAAVDAWLRKGEVLTDAGILTLNVNCDSRINTFDALGIVEAFVNGSTYGVVTKAATIASKK